MTACLRRQLDDIEVTPGVPDAEGLLEVAAHHPLGHAVIEADRVPWDVAALAAALRRHHPGVKLIGLFASARAVTCDGIVLLPRTATPEQVAGVVQPRSGGRPMPFVLTAAARNEQGPLTAQQLRVLALLSLGLTVAEVATRLGLSERGVAKSKMAIYSKLGVQSQAHAVAAALATGLLGPPSAPQPA